MTENFFGLHDITSESAHKQTNTNIELYIQLNPVYVFVTVVWATEATSSGFLRNFKLLKKPWNLIR